MTEQRKLDSQGSVWKKLYGENEADDRATSMVRARKLTETKTVRRLTYSIPVEIWDSLPDAPEPGEQLFMTLISESAFGEGAEWKYTDKKFWAKAENILKDQGWKFKYE